MFDTTSFLMGHVKGVSEGEKHIEIQSGLTATDDGDGNVTLTVQS